MTAVEDFQNARARSIQSSPSMAIALKARAMRAAGEPVVDLSLGEPDFDTPRHVVEAAYAAMLAGETHYTGPAGTEALRAAIVAKLKRDNALTYAPDQIAVGGGAKQIIFNAFLATLEAGDEVVIPAPYWVSYTDIARLHGGAVKTVACPAEVDFKLTPAALEAALTPRTRWLLLNSPSNPSGAVYSRSELRALGEVLAAYPRVLVMADEIYEHILFGEEPFASFPQACPDLAERILLVNGVSKAYAMTGWRLGYAAGPKGLIAAINKMQSQSVSCASSISQAAAVAALEGPQDFVAEARRAYAARRRIVVDGLAGIDGLDLVAPEGAFYVFPACHALIGRRRPDGGTIASDSDLADYLLAVGKVSSVPGAAFGLEAYLRFSFAASEDDLRQAVAQIGEAVARLES